MSAPSPQVVCLIDTTILCEFLAVPTKSNDVQTIQAQVADFAEQRATLLLPMATLIETGNHIAQNGTEHQRRDISQKFVTLVEGALSGQGRPFAVASFPNDDTVRRWLQVFPRYAQKPDRRGKGIGLADVSIVDEWERQCALNPRRRVLIWSLDHHLASRDRWPASAV
jgi:hypothetical protein